MSLVAWYPLNGNTLDYSGNGYNAIPKLKYRWYNTLNAYNTIGGHATNSTNMTYFFDTGYSSLGGEGYFTSSRISFGSTPNGTTIVDNLPSYITSVDNYSVELFGYINIPEDGIYTFGMDSDDSCELMIDNNIIISFYGGRGFTANFDVGATSLTLTKGYHKFKARFVEGGGGDGMAVAWKKPGESSFSFIPIQQFNVTDSILSGKIGKAALFNGVDTTIQLPAVAIPSTSVISFCVWNYGISAKYSCIIEAKSANNMRTLNIHLPWSDNTVYFDCGNNGTVYDRISKTATNEEYQGWHHWVFIKDCFSGIMKIYRDGLLWHSGTGLYLTLPETTIVAIGTDCLGNSNFHYGYINDVRIYDHALSEKEIKEIAKAKILHYTFDDFQEPTTNLIPDSNLMSGWTAYSNGNDGAFLTEFGNTGYQIINRLSWNGLYRGVTVPVVGTYTFSALFKYKGGTAPNNGAAVYVSGHGSPDTATVIDKSKINQWQRVSRTFTTVNTTFTLFLISYGGDSSVDRSTWDVTMPQLEFKGYMTDYTSTYRLGTINDQSGFRNNATLTEATTPRWISDSKIGSGAYEFSGNDLSKIYHTNSWMLEKYTISFWANRITENKMPIGSCGSIRNSNFYWYGDSSWKYIHGGVAGEFYYPKTFSIPQSVWGHYCVSYNGSSVKIYRNGVYEGSQATTGIADFTTGFSIGWGYGDSSYDFQGKMDDVRLYATALSDADILELYQTRASVDNRGNLFIGEIKNYYPIYKNQNEIQSYDNNFYVYAKQYPTDGSSEPTAGVYLEGIKAYSYSRDWHISVWDPTTNNWASNINFYQATSISGAHARYDVYNSTTRVAQQEAFVSTLQNLETKYIVIIGGSHAPEFYSAGMRDEMIKYGGTIQNLSWTSRESYILVGKKDIGAGNAIIEVLSNLSSTDNSGYTWARADFGLNYEINKISNEGMLLSSNISELGITNGLIAYYPLDKDARDYSGNGNHGTVSGAVLSNGIKNNAYSFNYTNLDSISISAGSSLSVTTEVTLSAWIKSNDITKAQNIISRNGPHFLRITNSTLRCGVYTGSWIFVNGSTILNSNTWYHLVLTYDGEFMKGYINSALEINNPKTGLLQSYGLLKIGYTTGGEDAPFDGLIDEVRIYNRALTSEEVSILYETTAPTTAAMKITKDTVYLKGEFKEVI